MNPAALAAFLNGDFENAAIAMTPGGIVDQEAQGQADFVASTTLPIAISYGNTREQFEAVGIVFGGNVDDLFCEATLPDGWHREGTDHNMHSNILDAKGRKRIGVFYKTAFYDRRASVSLLCRFGYSVRPVDGWDHPVTADTLFHCVVLDCNAEIVWQSESIGPEPQGNATREEWAAWHVQRGAIRDQGCDWLDEHYPDWLDPTVYWD